MLNKLQPWRRTADGALLRVRVTPKSSRESIEGIEDTADGPAIKIRVRAVPEDGAANQAVIGTVAHWLGMAKKSVALASGGKSRIKTIAISGKPDHVERALVEALAALPASKGKQQ